MTKNVGGIDRLLRAVIGIILIALAATGTVGWCPPYSLLGWNTCSTKTST